ncbi:TrkH family potassium uptake protein [Oscillibacter sp.]|jgi:trk system potassium uptake protein TrkH|uniref:TrkH family potassium uptake protein n=1 Tax=Oscillibacter sp. TaxID=1945593 RepID=UPI002172368C|nr:potassium transporter TrkG [Oscillibacter sp.]MCI9648616.1 Trk family potassium uptake protein [Oscillibacter sp.]
MVRRRVQLNAVQTLALGFAALILLGGVLLALPLSSRDGNALPFLDALFTSASASCVTGLVLYDTWTQFTLFGQAVILLLIQVGGMGFMTVSILVAILLHRRIGLRQRSILMDSVGALQMGGIVRLTRRAIRVTLTCEGTGAALLALWFCPRYGLGRGLWMSLFHAVSSFCNAGFDLLGTGTSLTSIAGEPLPNIVLMALVICGGLGFLVWDDLLIHGRHVRRWRLHSKIVVFSTTLLFVGGAMAFYFIERDYAFAGAGPGKRALMAAFQSVTCRTAGFNTAPLTALSQSGTLLTMSLMFIGAGSGSTGGGAKVNTIAVLFLSAAAQIRRKEDVNVFRRRLDTATIQRAYSSVSVFFMACLAGTMVMCLQGISLDSALFEAISAVGTVGLTRGVTPYLPELSKLTVLLMMFAGRVGSMSVAMAVTRDKPQPKLRNIPEKILIG